MRAYANMALSLSSAAFEAIDACSAADSAAFAAETLELASRSLPWATSMSCWATSSGRVFWTSARRCVSDMRDVISRLGAAEFFARAFLILLAATECGFVLSELLLELGDFEDSEKLALLDVRSPIDVELLDVAGDFRVDVDFLEGEKFGSDFEFVGKVLAGNFDHGNVGGVGSVGFCLAGRATASEKRRRQQRQKRKQNPRERKLEEGSVLLRSSSSDAIPSCAALCETIRAMSMNILLNKLTQLFDRKIRRAAYIDDLMPAICDLGGHRRNSIGNFGRYRKNAVTIGMKQISGTNIHASHVDRSAKIKYVGIGM